MLNRHRRDPRRLLAGSAIAVGLAVTSLLAGAPGLAAPVERESPAEVRVAVSAAPAAQITRHADRAAAPVSVPERSSAMRDEAKLAQEPARESTRVIIMDRRDGAAPPTTEGGVRREFRIRRDRDGNVTSEGLDPELQRRIEGCRDGNGALANIDEGNTDQRTRVIVCTQGGAGPANVEVLRRARERMASNDDLSPETRQRVLAELDRAIARARRD